MKVVGMTPLTERSHVSVVPLARRVAGRWLVCEWGGRRPVRLVRGTRLLRCGEYLQPKLSASVYLHLHCVTRVTP